MALTMESCPFQPIDPRVRAARAVLAELIGPPSQWPITICFWDGSVEPGRAGEAKPASLILREPGALRRMLLPPSELALGEAYLRDDFDVEGDLEAVIDLVDAVVGRLRLTARLPRLLGLLRQLPADSAAANGAAGPRKFIRSLATRHSRQRDAEAIRFHYDLSNDFYRLWLDERMVYSCAYFRHPDDDLDTAQEAKLDHLCRKLRLRPGERLLDIGCGFGGLIRYATTRYGVRAVGITLSPSQAEMARRRIAEDGLENRCRVLVQDYREVARAEQFDKIISVGMVEHVGRIRLPTYYQQVYRLLKPGGLFLNHGIVDLATKQTDLTARVLDRVWRPGEFIQHYVFPDGELVSPADLIAPAEQAGFETRDLESLREHYARTLRLWLRRLEAHHDEAARLVGEEQYRIWRLYMSGSALGFTRGRIGIVQALFSKRDSQGASGLPLTREDIYHYPGA